MREKDTCGVTAGATLLVEAIEGMAIQAAARIGWRLLRGSRVRSVWGATDQEPWTN